MKPISPWSPVLASLRLVVAACSVATAAWAQPMSQIATDVPVPALEDGQEAGLAAAPSSGVPVIVWDRRAVEHVWNRAGFGIHADEIDRWVAAGQVALVEYLLAPRPLLNPDGDGGALHEPTPSFVFEAPRIDPSVYAQQTLEERRAYRSEARKINAAAMRDLRHTWVRQIFAGDDPLRDRMTMFWHSVFTSSYATVRNARPIVLQHDTLRSGALGSYDALLRAMLHDAALLRYLDNDKNRKGKPNENLAREVMELFSLGEGNYTEADVGETARALTGAGAANQFYGGDYRFYRKRHDSGVKTILGVEGRHSPDDVASILLDQPSCARFIAGSLIEYLEGVAPTEERLERHARTLRETDYDVGFLVRKILLDPAFYRDEIIGARISSPMDYLAGVTRRLGVSVPPAFVASGAAIIGQTLFEPPNVKGWDEGLAWMSTANFMLRGNIAGAILGQVDAASMRSDAMDFVEEMAGEAGMEEMSSGDMQSMGREQLRRDEMNLLVRLLRNEKYEVGGSLTRDVLSDGARSDRAVIESLLDRLLAIEAPEETIVMLERRLALAREATGLPAKRFVQSRGKAEPVLRELAHLILSLPEAQIH